MIKIRNIGIFGRRNVGKSSLINLLLGQQAAIVSPVAGTTTDPVKKRLEIPGIGTCTLIDTAGMDDSGDLGEMRIKKTEKVMAEIDMGILVFAGNIFAKEEKNVLKGLRKKGVPVLALHNQSDIVSLDPELAFELNTKYGLDVMEFSCCMLDEQEQEESVEQLLALVLKGLSEYLQQNEEKTILQGLVNEGDEIILVCPVDSEAPQGRLILPQVMAIRDILDHSGMAVVLQPSQLKEYIREHTRPIKLVVTDSQVFKEVEQALPLEIPLTSFSILMARAKGPFDEYVLGMKQIDNLKEGDTVLILESCTHHTTCDDIGRVKIPRKLLAYLSARDGGNAPDIRFVFISGLDQIPPDGKYALAIQCGGCMVTRKQLVNRITFLTDQQIPVTNYGMALAYMDGIMNRVSLFNE